MIGASPVLGASKRLAHVHVIGFEFEQLGQRFCHGLEAAAEVEPHGVLRWRRRDDHVWVAGAAGDLLELLGQTAAVTRCTQGCGDVNSTSLLPGKRGLGDIASQTPTPGDRSEIGAQEEYVWKSGSTPSHLGLC